MPIRIVLLAVMALQVGQAQAHGLVGEPNETRLPLILSGLLLVALWLAYCKGVRRVPPTKGRWLLFQGACLIALLTTFDTLSDWIGNGSAMHMIQHMLIMVVITPFFALARPLPQWLAVCGRAGFWLWQPLLRLSRYPLRTGCLQGIVIWFWHAPTFYNLALANPWWHLVEHVSFALGAGLFWWSVLSRRATAALPALLFTLIHTGMLGALLTFTQIPLYGDLGDLQDQQLAGLIMWIPGGLPYMIAGGWCSQRLFNRVRE